MKRPPLRHRGGFEPQTSAPAPTSPPPKPGDLMGTYEYPAEVVHQRAAETCAMNLENKRLRWALEEACDTAWSDGPAAMAGLLRKAEVAIPGEVSPPADGQDGAPR